jgi:TolA-binding protein
MNKEIEEVRAILNKLEYPTENKLTDLLMYVNYQQQKIEQLEKEVDRLRVDNYHLENNMKISEERIEELEEDNNKLLSCSYCGSFDIRKD